MDEHDIAAKGRTGPVRPPRPSQSFDYVGPSPRVTPRTSVDFQAKLKRRKSSSNTRSTSQLQSQLSPGNLQPFRYSGATSGTGATGGSERKKSFRRAVRRLFGKKDKDELPPVTSSKPPPSGHGYHQSDPGLMLRTSIPQPLMMNPPIPPSARTFSLPPQIPKSPSLHLRSPTAMAFPKSAQLKPLELANPFYHRPGPKRRATLPTLDVTNRESAATGTAIASPPDSGMGRMAPDLPFGVPESQIGLAVSSTPMAEKRRSRSAHDLRQAYERRLPSRKRSEEIRYWRESFSGAVLLNPNTPPEAPREIDPLHHYSEIESVTPRVEAVGPLPLARSITPAALSEDDISPALFEIPEHTSTEAERTEDLERRVAHLESSLHEFQRSLDRLTVTSRATTVSPGPRSYQVRRQQTPSILIDTLQHPSWRPESLNGFPENRDYEDAGEVMEREWGGASNRNSRPVSPIPELPPSRPMTAGAAEDILRPGTFIALYNMLGDERAARHRLQTEVRSLQQEVTTMATRLERGSWNSYSAPPLPMIPAQYRPRTPDESVRATSREENATSTFYDQRIVSRFSGSDSYVGSEAYALASGQSRQDRESLMVDEQSRRSTGTWLNYRPRSQGRAQPTYGVDEEMF